MADFKVTASQLNTQAESLQDLNGRFKSAIEQLVTCLLYTSPSPRDRG